MQILYDVNHDDVKSWSLIDSKPVLKYIPHCDEYLVFWNGIVMPHKMALAIAMSVLCNCRPNPQMRKLMEIDYKKLYYSGAFGHRSWDEIIESGSNMYYYIHKIISNHVSNLKDVPRHEVLSWFDYSNAIRNQ